jgi:TRAP-type transport system periplasmic protein
MPIKTHRFKTIALLAIMGLLSACSSENGTQATPSSPNQNAAGAAAKPEKTIVLKGITAWEENNIQSAGYVVFKKKLEELSNGRIKIQYAGGPEAIPPFNQAEAVRNGVVDFSVLAPAYYSNQVPEVAVIDYSELSVEEEWNSGAMNFLNEIHHQKLNAQVLGRANFMGYSIYTKKPVNRISDFKGMRIRATPSYLPFIKALGAEAVIMPAGETYTAIERGVIDAVAWPEGGITDLGLEKQVKYKIFPAYYKVGCVIIMNLDKWKQLSKDDQDLINKAMREVEKEVPGVIAKYIEDEQKKLTQAGVQAITLQDGPEYLKTSSDSAWNWMESNIPDNGKKLKELFKKK